MGGGGDGEKSKVSYPQYIKNSCKSILKDIQTNLKMRKRLEIVHKRFPNDQ